MINKHRKQARNKRRSGMMRSGGQTGSCTYDVWMGGILVGRVYEWGPARTPFHPDMVTLTPGPPYYVGGKS